MKSFYLSSSVKDVMYCLHEQLFVSARVGNQVYTIEYFKDEILACPVLYNFTLT